MHLTLGFHHRKSELDKSLKNGDRCATIAYRRLTEQWNLQNPHLRSVPAMYNNMLLICSSGLTAIKLTLHHLMMLTIQQAWPTLPLQPVLGLISAPLNDACNVSVLN